MFAQSFTFRCLEYDTTAPGSWYTCVLRLNKVRASGVRIKMASCATTACELLLQLLTAIAAETNVSDEGMLYTVMMQDEQLMWLVV